jgi:hypothetical protein
MRATFNHAIVAAAIEKEMSRLPHASAAYSALAERKMVSPRALDHELRPLFRAWPLGIGSDIAYGLLDQRPITRRRGFPKFPLAPSQNFTDILASRKCAS